MSEESFTKAEAKAFLDKHHLDFSEVQYAHYFKQIGTLEPALVAYEALGEAESATVAKLREQFKSLDEKLAAGYPALADESYPAVHTDELLRAALNGDAEQLSKLISSYELRALPYIKNENQSSQFFELRTYTREDY